MELNKLIEGSKIIKEQLELIENGIKEHKCEEEKVCKICGGPRGVNTDSGNFFCSDHADKFND